TALTPLGRALTDCADVVVLSHNCYVSGRWGRYFPTPFNVCGAGPGPDQADTVAFWRGLWSEPVNHSEGPWIEVVASQSASVTPMDPVTITPEDVAEAVRRAPNWKSPGLDGLHHYWLKGFVVCHAMLARQYQEALNQKSLPSLFTTGMTHLVPKDQDTTDPEQIPPHHVSIHYI
ncbi:unnamed protein product, partial [Parnassius apollo]